MFTELTLKAHEHRQRMVCIGIHQSWELCRETGVSNSGLGKRYVGLGWLPGPVVGASGSVERVSIWGGGGGVLDG